MIEFSVEQRKKQWNSVKNPPETKVSHKESIRRQNILGLVVYNDTKKMILNHPVAPQDTSRAVCIQTPTGVVVITGVHNT